MKSTKQMRTEKEKQTWKLKQEKIKETLKFSILILNHITVAWLQRSTVFHVLLYFKDFLNV